MPGPAHKSLKPGPALPPKVQTPNPGPTQHTDVTRSLLGAEATPAEAAALDAIQYTSNDVWLHTDQSLMPRRRAAWASWNCVVKEGGKGEGSDLVCCSYWVNLLQNLPPGAHIA